MSFPVPTFLRNNPYLSHLYRRIYPHLLFLLPHEDSFYGFKHLAKGEDGLFLDIGANDGISALGFHQINSHYRIFSVEPNRYHEPALQKIKGRLKGFDYLIAAAGAMKSKMTLHMPFYKNIPLYTAASGRRDFVEASMERQFSERDRRNVVYKTQEVDVVRLDDLGLRPDIIKMDTEGFDDQVLAGLSETIHKHRPYILVEYNPDLIEKIKWFFTGANYVLFIYSKDADLFSFFDPQRELQSHQNSKMVSIFCVPQEKRTSLPLVK